MQCDLFGIESDLWHKIPVSVFLYCYLLMDRSFYLPLTDVNIIIIKVIV